MKISAFAIILFSTAPVVASQQPSCEVNGDSKGENNADLRELQSCSTKNCNGNKVCCSGYTCDGSNQCIAAPTPTPPPPTTPTPAPVLPTDPPTNAPVVTSGCSTVTYFPGELTVSCDGLLLSQGLTCRKIATTGTKVAYDIGGESSASFHDQPDAGACFPSGDGGWYYVSNAEVSGGGVGSIRFDSAGQIINYEMIATSTNRNCGGGRTSWGTWVTCEEDGSNGEVFETYPDGSHAERTTVLGNPRGNFESMAQDDNWNFYVTNDSSSGELRRYRPAQSVIDAAISSGDYSNVLHSAGGTMDYLVLSGNTATGTFDWSTSVTDGRNSANQDGFPYAEGIDHRDGKLYFVSKTTKRLFILDLAAKTFERHSTVSGAFNNQPDQIKFILGDADPNAILYFCEDGGSDCGVHGRDSTAKFFTILDGPAYNTETTGLAFNPDATKMYVSFQGPGHIFEIWREDGCAFWTSNTMRPNQPQQIGVCGFVLGPKK